jgi:hypothetical protein
MALAERAPVAHTVQAALPELAPGVSVALLKRVWNATPANRKHLRGSLLESIVCVTVGGYSEAKPLRDLSLAEVEKAIGAVTPRFVVRWYQDGLKGVQATTFVVREDADKFAAGKKIYGRPSVVRELGL